LVAQNVFVLLSVALRLKLYIEAYDMTVLRLSVMIFLVLVAAGFGLLTVKIIHDRSLSWLIGGCMLAVFTTFYVTQFLDLKGWSANYNVAQWVKDPNHKLDRYYLGHLGPAAWPAIHRAYIGNPTFNPETHDAWNIALVDEKNVPKANFDSQHWREFSLRAWMNRWALDEKSSN